MKKTLLALLSISLIFISCSSDDKSDFDYDLNTLYGTWDITHVDMGTGYQDITTIESVGTAYATFNSNGTFSGGGSFGAGSGTYKAEGKRITCYIGGLEYAYYDIISLTGTTCELDMHLTVSTDVGNLKIKCKKRN